MDFEEEDVTGVIVKDALAVSIAVTDGDTEIEGDDDSADESVANDVIVAVTVVQLVAVDDSDARPVVVGLCVLVTVR